MSPVAGNHELCQDTVTAIITFRKFCERPDVRPVMFRGAGSPVALQTLYCYLSQFSALAATLLQLAFLLILLAYRRWCLQNT
jgi:hypothetical protein